MSRRSSRRISESQRNATTCLAAVALMIVAAGLIGLTAIVLPQIRGIILVVAGFAAVVALHYVTWGRWLSQIRDDTHDDDSTKSD